MTRTYLKEKFNFKSIYFVRKKPNFDDCSMLFICIWMDALAVYLPMSKSIYNIYLFQDLIIIILVPVVIFLKYVPSASSWVIFSNCTDYFLLIYRLL